MTPLSRPTPFTFALLVVAASGLLMLVAPFASADEFEVGVLLDPDVDESDGSTFMEGFQLAVDQSPDVSHPSGAEGGDHLGSMDVVMVVVDDAVGPAEFLAAATAMVERQAPAIIVADVSAEILTAFVGPITESETMLIVMSDVGGVELHTTPFVFVAESDRIETLLSDRTPSFEDAFVAAYGRAPSAAATRGYLAGRLVDLAVEATDRDPSDEVALGAALLAAGDPTAVTDAEPSSRLGNGLVVVAVVAVVAIMALILRSISTSQRAKVKP